MKTCHILRFLFFSVLLPLSVSGAQPIRLHPQNPHYFEFRGRPIVLVASTEHYGSVLNADFDYKTYLDAIARHGLNLTRIFMGNFCERRIQRESNSSASPLSPRADRFLTPWARSSVEGYPGGGNKFDLDRWDPAYFERLTDFCREASRRGIVVEVVLFSALYRTDYWRLSPLHAGSNINGIGDLPMTEFHTLKHASLVAKQKEMTRKVVQELRDFDNVYFEICNEPYWAKGIPEVDPSIKEQNWPPDMMEWQTMIGQTIVEAEAGQASRHLIAQNVANTYYKIEAADPSVSILNFHYAYPPKVVPDNYHLNRVIAFDETSNGCNAPDRRREAWAFLMSGGAVYDNLDFSFTVDDPTGRGRTPKGRRQSCAEVRDQLGTLLRFVNRLDLAKVQPLDRGDIAELPSQVKAFGLKRLPDEFVLYLVKEDFVELKTVLVNLPKGRYSLEWIDPIDARVIAGGRLTHSGGPAQLTPPPFGDDIALAVRKR